jgi:lipopolysaccharide/colanic/teichoic acid biosynthesis glycosyltransferase
MESVLEAPENQADQSLYEITVFTKRILRIDGHPHVREHNYLHETTFFTYVSVEEAIYSIRNSEVVDAILLHSQAVVSDIKPLISIAREKAVPVIWYTSKFEADAKKKALHHNADDYHFGAITPVFLKRIEALKKLKTYKNTRGDKPYETFTEDAPRFHQWALKRAMDIAVSLTLLMLLAPFLILIAIAIKLESKGPVFYISKRAGSGYRIFNFYKFRSMRTGAENELKHLAHINQYAATEENGVFFKIKNDPRVTPFGSFLRKTSLDEIPQLMNVLLGDMSLVGNRPLPLYEAAQLTNNKIAWRFLAPAGITGLWQITKRGKDNMSAEERIALDMEYAMNRSFMLDLKILVSTLPALLQKENV